jgi:hypothetical protein
MRLLPLAVAAAVLSFSYGVAAAGCDFHQAKSMSEVATTTPGPQALIDRLVALLPEGTKDRVTTPRDAGARTQ